MSEQPENTQPQTSKPKLPFQFTLRTLLIITASAAGLLALVTQGLEEYVWGYVCLLLVGTAIWKRVLWPFWGAALTLLFILSPFHSAIYAILLLIASGIWLGRNWFIRRFQKPAIIFLIINACALIATFVILGLAIRVGSLAVKLPAFVLGLYDLIILPISTSTAILILCSKTPLRFAGGLIVSLGFLFLVANYSVLLEDQPATTRVFDANGNVMLDESGQPILKPNSSVLDYNRRLVLDYNRRQKKRSLYALALIALGCVVLATDRLKTFRDRRTLSETSKQMTSETSKPTTKVEEEVKKPIRIISILGCLSCVIAVSLLFFWLVNLPEMRSRAGYGFIFFLVFLVIGVGCFLGILLAMIPIIFGRVRRFVAVVGLTLNLVLAIAYGVYDWWPSTPRLMSAVHNRDIKDLNLCLALGVDVNEPLRWGWGHDYKGDSPLTAAAEKGSLDVMEILIEAGADPSLWDGHGETPLIAATRSGKKEVIEFLISSGADINQKDKSRKTPLDWARLYDHKDIEDFLRERGAQ